MTVFVNSEAQELETNSSLFDLMQKIGLLERKGIAIALNNKVITKSKWAEQTLSPEDKVTIIKATQGG